MKRARILVLQMKRIGDLILTAPAIADLRGAFPEAEIVMVVAGNCVDLAECFPGVTQVLRYDTGRVNAALWAAVSVGGWDVCLDFTGTDRAALLTQLSGAKERVGYRKFCGKHLRARAYTTLCEASVRELHTVAFHRALVAEVGAKKGGDDAGAVFGFNLETEMAEGEFAAVIGTTRLPASRVASPFRCNRSEPESLVEPSTTPSSSLSISVSRFNQMEWLPPCLCKVQP